MMCVSVGASKGNNCCEYSKSESCRLLSCIHLQSVKSDWLMTLLLWYGAIIYGGIEEELALCSRTVCTTGLLFPPCLIQCISARPKSRKMQENALPCTWWKQQWLHLSCTNLSYVHSTLHCNTNLPAKFTACSTLQLLTFSASITHSVINPEGLTTLLKTHAETMQGSPCCPYTTSSIEILSN